MPIFYAAVLNLPNKIQRDYILLLLFTGLRREAAASLTWDQIDVFKFPMSDFVHDLLAARKRFGGEHVFPANSESGYISEPKQPLSLIAKATGIKVSAHDLRRLYHGSGEHRHERARAQSAGRSHPARRRDRGLRGYGPVERARSEGLQPVKALVWHQQGPMMVA
jgi:integrase